MAEEKPDLERIYDLFTALSVHGDVGGQLVFYRSLDASGAATAAAANIAGAASLGVEADAERIKQALREGICDFMVNHLDEALRILKNEIRKRQPVSVCLNADPERCVAEMAERGVQPDILVSDMALFIERGARVAIATTHPPHYKSVTWGVAEQPARWLPKLDGIVTHALDAADLTTAARARWLRFAPRYVGRALHHQRFLPMTGPEFSQFLALAQQTSVRGEISVPIKIAADGSETLIG